MQLFKNLPRGTRPVLGSSSKPSFQLLSQLKLQHQQRGYFSFTEKVKDKFFKPWRHIQSFMEPDGMNYES